MNGALRQLPSEALARRYVVKQAACPACGVRSTEGTAPISAVIGELHFSECGPCVFNDPAEGCTVELQEIVDNMNIEGGNCVCCGCFQALEAPGEGTGPTDDGGAL